MYYKRHDAITKRIINFLKIRPRRLYELQHEIGQLSSFGLLHKMNTLEIQGVVFAERSPEHKSTIYYLLPDKEKESDGETPLTDDLQTVKGGNDARIRE
jgi:DNA-binding HxlR family transcriptional regulator